LAAAIVEEQKEHFPAQTMLESDKKRLILVVFRIGAFKK
jgi:hypothetical protein